MTYAQFLDLVKSMLSDHTRDDPNAIRAVADFVKATAARDLAGDLNTYNSLWPGYLEQRKNLLGYSITANDTDLQAAVRRLITDDTINDTTAIGAIANYVKARICREVDKDIELYNSYNAEWQRQKNRLLGYAVISNTSTIRTEVNKLITVDGGRQGISTYIDTLIPLAVAEIAGLNNILNDYISLAKRDLAGAATSIDSYIRQAVIEIQEYIPLYRVGHSTVFAVADLTENGEASDGAMPDGARIRDAYYVFATETCTRNPVDNYDWGNRFDLTCGTPMVNRGQFLMAIAPDGKTFTLFPKLLTGNNLQIFWDGTKLEFAGGDTVPFDEPMAKAVSDYVLSEISRRSPVRDLRAAGIHLDAYKNKIRSLYRMAKDRTRVNMTEPSRFPDPKCAVATTT